MIILGGLGSIWGAALGAIILQLVNRYLIPDVLNDKAQQWFHFDLTQLSFSIFGFILVLVMLIRPEGLLPERRRKMELREGIGTGETEASGLIEVQGGPTRSTPPRASRRPSAASSPSTASRSRYRRAESCRSSGRTAPGRPPSSTSSRASTSRPRGS